MIRNASREILAYRDFFLAHVRMQLATRYQGSVLGFLWTLLNPLLVYSSLTLVFSQLNHWNLADYGMYFFSGFLAWNLFANSSTLAADSVVANSAYVTRVAIPKAIFPLAAVAVNVIDLAAGFAIVLSLAGFLGRLSWAMLFVPIAAMITVVFVAGVSLFCAWCNVFLRDFRHLLASALFVWFFFSPILWRASSMPSNLAAILNLNPIVPFLHLFQKPIWAASLPSLQDIGITSGLACAVFMAGFIRFLRSERDFYYYL
jgi:ABC-type polysaccharide/polyol phosphate export permease